MSIKLIEHITWKSILKFTLPTIIMMIFMSLYQMIDAVFISNYVSTNALSAVNIVFPVISLLIGLAVMLGTGGNAIIAKNMGEGRFHQARSRFTLVVVIGIVIGLLSAAAGIFFIEDIVRLLGASEVLYQYCVDYLLTLLFASPFAVLQLLFQSFFPAAGKPNLGLAAVAAGGVANIVLDYLFIVQFGWGVKGAAVATAIGYAIPAIYGLLYFTLKRDGMLYFVKPVWEAKVLLDSCLNGSSEMVTNLANGVTTFLFNMMMMRYLGEDGVAAITVILYVQFLLSAVYIGYSGGIAPVISYYYGCLDAASLRKLIKTSSIFIAINSILWYALSFLLKTPVTAIFVRPGSNVWQIVDEGWGLFALTYLLTGFNIFASAMFTAFSDGKRSALISFLRTFAFLSVCILGLPYLIGATGIWLAVPVAEALTLIVSAVCFLRNGKRYHYLPFSAP